MRVNHLIIGAKDLRISEEFYQDVFGFKKVDTFVDTGTWQSGSVLVFFEAEIEQLELLLVPFDASRLPNPQHLALEVNAHLFNEIYQRVLRLKLKVRAQPAIDSKELGVGTFVCRSQIYKRFYLLDPAGVNVEVMKLKLDL